MKAILIKLYAKLEEEMTDKNATDNYVTILQEIKEKAAEEYKKAKQATGNAWVEFENFTANFEKAVLSAK